MPKLFEVSFSRDSLDQVFGEIRERKVNVGVALSGAINDTAKHAVTHIGQMIRQKVNLKKQTVEKVLYRTRANPQKLLAVVTVSKTKRISLADFGAHQTKKGVTYRIEKAGSLRRVSAGFGPEIARLGNNVFVRVGKSRLPIRKLYGVSPWGVYVKGGMPQLAAADAQAFLANRVEHRLEHQTSARRSADGD